MKRITIFLCVIIFTVGNLFSQEMPVTKNNVDLKIQKTNVLNQYYKQGTIFKTINLIGDRTPFGVTVVNSQIIITSTNENALNYFDVYDIAGNYISSTLQSTTSQYGYRDLAFDGTYILASDDSTIKKIDPNTFQVVSQITNGGNSPHRGLAYDPNENVIYSSNYRWHNILKIDPATGATIKTLNKPTQNVYGLAIDYFSNPNYASLWFAEPTSYSAFRLSRADTSFTRINFTYDLTAATPDSAVSGGLEIINNYPGYADSVIALIVDQKNYTLNLVNITGTPQTFPASLELVGEFQGFDASGIITSGMVQYDNYLYSVDNQNLAIYEITTNPAIPTFVKSVTVPNGNRIFLEGNFGNNIIVTTQNAGQYGFAAFSLADPLNPQLESWTGTTNSITAMDVGSYSYVLAEGIVLGEGLKKLLVYYMGNFTNPVLNNSYNLQGVGVCLAKDPDQNLLFVGTKGNGGLENGFQVFDYSNPNTLVEKYHTSFIGEYPQRIVVIPSENKIIIGANSTTTGSLLESFDYSDPTNLVIKKLQYISFTKSMWDMRLVDNMITVTEPEDGKFLTYKWDDASNIFLIGPSADLTEPIDIISYLPVSPPQNINDHNSTFRGPGQDRYFYIPNGYASGTQVAGSEKTSIIKTKQPPAPPAVKVNLIMNINPPEATAFSVSTIPASGTHEYNIGEVVNLTAIPNEAVGWYFTGWTGDASGTNANTNITMDIDKNVTANFDLLELTVSGYVGSDTFFPESNGWVFLPFNVCASEVDSWVLQKISFRASGTLDDANDVIEIQLLRGVNEVFYTTGGYSSDNGSIDITFTPPIVIGAGECVNFTLKNYFEINNWDYSNESFHDIKSFHVESFGVTAMPLNFTGGIIAGKAKNDSLYYAQIRNSELIPFHTINAAIESPLTFPTDIITVGDDWYSENIKLNDPNRQLTLITRSEATEPNGPHLTFLTPDESDTGSALIKIVGDNKKILGFTFSNAIADNFGIQRVNIVLNNANNCVIKNNIFKNVGLIDTYNSSHNKYIDNVVKEDIDGESSLSISIRGDYNLVKNNQSADSTSQFFYDEILLDFSDNNIIENNKNMSIYLIKFSTNNTISNNTNAEIIELNNGSKNEIKYNIANQIVLNDEYDSRLFHNDIKIIKDVDGILINQDGLGSPIVLDRNNIHGDFYSTGAGINAKGGGYLFIKNNEISDFRTDISIIDFTRVVINKNQITLNPLGGEVAISIQNSHNVDINSNKLKSLGKVGIKLDWSERVFIEDNFFKDFFVAIKQSKSVFVRIVFNEFSSVFGHGINIKNSVSSKELTGIGSIIKLNNSSPLIFGNNIIKGNGYGIYSENNSIPVITNNNIYGKGAFQIENSDPNVTFSADNNFWGSPTGPAPQDVSGNININSWLSEEVSLLALPAIDTTLSKINTSDSVSLFIQNLKTLDDIVNVTVNDDKGWVTSISNLQLQLQDTTGYELPVKYNVPANAQTNEISTVNYSVTSTSDSNTVSGVFYINTYAQNLTTLLINSDSLTTGFGQSVQFNAVGFDQNGNPVGVSPLWSTNKGIILQTGLLVPDSTSGEGIITLTDETTGMQANAHFYNTDQEVVLHKIIIDPDSVTLQTFNGFLFRAKGYNQFNYPKDFVQVWNSSGGTIDNIGFFIPDSVSAQYIVTVSDTTNSFIDSAVVIMDVPTGVEDEAIIPQKYSLSQNYPNPFNPTTTIKFSLKESSPVKLEVFNILGERILVPVNKFMRAGTYIKVLNFNKYASGVYFYRLIVKGKFIDVKKLILLK